jgi:hypothetical protein
MKSQCRATRFFAAALPGAAAFGALLVALACSKAPASATAAPRVVLITPAEAAAPRQFRGAEAFVRDYSSSSKGSAVHAVFPESRGSGDPGAIAAFIAESARDPRVAAILVAPAPEGTAEGFRRAKATRGGASRPGLLCVASGSSEEALVIESSADLVVDLDRLYRSYIAVWAAKKMGASALVAAYARAEADDPDARRERAIMAAASAELGLRYAALIAPKGLDAAAFVRAGTGAWMRDYGPKDVALYCSDAALLGPLLAGAVAGGGIVAEAAGETTRAACAQALGIDLSEAKGDPLKERRLLEKAAIGLGMSGRLGLWDSGYAEESTRGLGEFAMRVCSGAARKDELKGLVAALDARSGGAAWLADYDVDPDTGVKSSNRVLLRQDVYVLGKGYLQSALQAVPSKYLALVAGTD